MTEKWKDMMARSPYHVDQLKEDDIRRKKMEEKELRVKAYREKVAAVAAMTGRAQETILTKENSKNLDPQTKLVLKLRQAYRDEAVIKTEKEILDSMLSTELRTIASKFSALPILDELSRSGTLGDQSTIESESKTNSQELPQSKATASSKSPSNNRPKNNKSPPAGGKKKENLENESSILSGPLEYTSPNARMKQLQDDVSVEFALKNYDSLDKLP
jgi:plasmid stability protein